MERTIELIDILHEDYYAIGRAQYPAKAVKRDISLFILTICSKEDPPSSRRAFNFVSDSS